jgi:Flp pilus assembly protein TadB
MSDEENRHYNPELDRLHPDSPKGLVNSPFGSGFTIFLFLLPELIVAAVIGYLFGPLWAALILIAGVGLTFLVVSMWS